jgi:2'-5' RNA ligase
MINRWECRTEPKPGEGQLYWHILFKDHPHVAALASIGQEKLAGLAGLHFTPREWLHITLLIPGSATDFTSSEIEDMANHARRLLAGLPSVSISLSKIIYHPEAIVLEVKPDGALDPVRKAVRKATSVITHRSETAEHQLWTPHVTLAYSTADQPAGPIIAALGREFPPCEVTISSICLVVQEGAERLWNWHTIEEVQFGATTFPAGRAAKPSCGSWAEGGVARRT